MQHASKPTVYRWRGLQGPGPSFQDCGKNEQGPKTRAVGQTLHGKDHAGRNPGHGCPLCSYAHTKMALEMGMQEEQIEELLGGELKNIPQEQLKAVLFGQPYAEMKGKPSRLAWEEIVHVYGEDTATGILGTIRIMMVGNIWGVVIGLLKDRIQLKKVDVRSSLGYELLLTFSIIPFLPIAVMHALAAALIGTPLLKFAEP